MVQMVLVVGPFRAEYIPEVCKQIKCELPGTILASPTPIFAFQLLNKLPLQMALVVIGPYRAEHNPKICQEIKFELSGWSLALSASVFRFQTCLAPR